jgi:hypothetical protein
METPDGRRICRNPEDVILQILNPVQETREYERKRDGIWAVLFPS